MSSSRNDPLLARVGCAVLDERSLHITVTAQDENDNGNSLQVGVRIVVTM